MNALETLLGPLTELVNRQLALHTAARELCVELDGRVIAVRVRDTALIGYFFVDAAGIRLSGTFDGDPDVVITGSLLTLAALADERSGEAAVRDGSLTIGGDAGVAQSFQRLLRYARPDVEEQLSRLVGDAAAHTLGRLARDAAGWGRQARATFRDNVSEYLQEESRAVPSRHEALAFRREVETLRDDVERLEARLRRLESAGGSGAGTA